MCMIGIGWVLSAISFGIALMAIRRIRIVERKLRDEYWTKDVIGKTINAKTGRDQKAAEKRQEKVLNGEVEEVRCGNTKEFCEELRKNAGNEPVPCCNPKTRQLGFSHVESGQKFYTYIGLVAFKRDQNNLPVKLGEELEASEVVQKLIDHYGKECKK